VGLLLGIMLVVLYAQPAEANYPGTPGKIAYSGWDGNDLEIYTINPNGGSRKNVTNNNTDDIQPSYSPSGKNIAYAYDPGTGDTEMYYIKPDGGGRKNVTNNNTDNFYPYWGCKGGCK